MCVDVPARDEVGRREKDGGRKTVQVEGDERRPCPLEFSFLDLYSHTWTPSSNTLVLERHPPVSYSSTLFRFHSIHYSTP